MIEDALQQTTQRVDEAIRRYPPLVEYADILKPVFFDFYEKGGMVRFDDYLTSPSIEPRPLNGKRVVNLVIGVKDRTDHLSVIWSAFHEWGHLCQPAQTEDIRLSPALTYEREKGAWEIAERAVREIAVLLPHIQQFEQYRDYCLSDYQSKIPDAPES